MSSSARRRGRTVASVTALLVLGAVGAAAYCFRGSLREQYLIWRLGSDSSEVSHRAAEELAAMKSRRGAEAIVERLRSDDAERIHFKATPAGWQRILTPLLYALHLYGPEIRPLIEAALAEEVRESGTEGFEGAEGLSPMWFIPESAWACEVVIHPPRVPVRLHLYLREVLMSWRNVGYMETRRSS